MIKKNNINESIIFLYLNDKDIEKEIGETLSFIIASKTKQQTFEIQKREIAEDT